MKSSIKIEMKESRIQVMDYLKGYSIYHCFDASTTNDSVNTQ